MRNLDLYFSKQDLSNKNTDLYANGRKTGRWQWHSSKSARHDSEMVFDEMANYDKEMLDELDELEAEYRQADRTGDDFEKWQIEMDIASIRKEAREDFWIFSASNNKPMWMIEEERRGKVETHTPTHKQIAEMQIESRQIEIAKSEWLKLRKKVNCKGIITTNKMVASLAKLEGYRVSQNGNQLKIKK